MKIPLALIGIGLVGFALPAAAQDTDYWVVQNTTTKHCEIVTQRPVGQDMTIIGGDGVVYHTRVEAEGAMKKTKICTSD